MIFARLNFSDRFEDIHDRLVVLLTESFDFVESGLQGDSWIWIRTDGGKVAVDTFTSMSHQVKSDKPGRHVEAVIEVLGKNFPLEVYHRPEMEAHERTD